MEVFVNGIPRIPLPRTRVNRTHRPPRSGTLRGEASYLGRLMGTMSSVFTGLLKRARDPERERVRRLNEAYARWNKKYRARKRRERERRNPRQR
jgi:hypothetical protein